MKDDCVKMSRWIATILIGLLLTIIGFSWDTRERLIKVETSLMYHMETAELAKVNPPLNFLWTPASADTLRRKK